MRKYIYSIFVAMLALVSCDDDDIQVFEKTADERAAEAIATLKADLIEPANGWRVKYTPVDGAGSFYVLMKFGEDNKVRIRSDVSTDERSYVDQVIGYRIDNSLGLELIFESYTMFHYLYELDQATFAAEYEFDFVNKTPDNALVFVSKSDFSNKSTILFEEASPGDLSLLGITVDENLETLSNDFDSFNLFSSSVKVQFTDKDLILYGGLDVAKRTFNISAAARKSDPETFELLAISTPYILQGNSVLFDTPISGNFVGLTISVGSLTLTSLSTGGVQPCADLVPIHIYSGQTSAGDAITLESTIVNAGGRGFTGSTLFVAPLSNIRKDGGFVLDEIEQDLPDASEMYLLNNFSYRGQIITGIGFFLQDAQGDNALAYKAFSASFDSNKVTFTFEPDIRYIVNEDGAYVPDANTQNITKYLDALTEGGNTYVYKYADGIYEFNNLCNGWTAAFIALD
ncbi:MAG TPA: DUF4302 domain-containing protein [Chryseosolibacter sp.]